MRWTWSRPATVLGHRPASPARAAISCRRGRPRSPTGPRGPDLLEQVVELTGLRPEPPHVLAPHRAGQELGRGHVHRRRRGGDLRVELRLQPARPVPTAATPLRELSERQRRERADQGPPPGRADDAATSH